VVEQVSGSASVSDTPSIYKIEVDIPNSVYPVVIIMASQKKQHADQY